MERLQGVTFVATFLILVPLYGYGIYRFPHAPIRERGGEFFDKGGAPKTLDDFQDFTAWKSTAVTATGVLIGVNVLFAVITKKRPANDGNGDRLNR